MCIGGRGCAKSRVERGRLLFPQLAANRTSCVYEWYVFVCVGEEWVVGWVRVRVRVRGWVGKCVQLCGYA